MYISKNEFIFAIFQIPENQKKIKELKEEISKCEYLLYEKVRNPNDYDIIGYDSKKEAIRSFKPGRQMTPDEKWDLRDKIEEEMKLKQTQLKELEMRVSEAEKALYSLDPFLQKICVMKFIEGKSYEKISDELGNTSASSLFRYVNKELNKKFELKGK